MIETREFQVQYRDSSESDRDSSVQHRGLSRLSGRALRVNETLENIPRATEARWYNVSKSFFVTYSFFKFLKKVEMHSEV